MRPALNIRGMRSGQVGAEAANAIPVDAVVSVDFRLVPGQTPERVRAKTRSLSEVQGLDHRHAPRPMRRRAWRIRASSGCPGAAAIRPCAAT